MAEVRVVVDGRAASVPAQQVTFLRDEFGKLTKLHAVVHLQSYKDSEV